MKCRDSISLVLSLILATTHVGIESNLKLRVMRAVAEPLADCPPTGRSENFLAYITKIEGEVMLQRRNKSRCRAQRLDQLYEGDSLILTRKASVSVRCVAESSARNLIGVKINSWVATYCPRQSLQLHPPVSLRLLRLGDRGSDVTAVQMRLRELGYLNANLTGYFGSTTQEAVSRFQRDNNIEDDGVVSSQTRAALFGSARVYGDALMLPPPPHLTQVLRLGDRDSEVGILQQELRQRGFNPGRVDGIYDVQTESAVRQFQRSMGLFPDGIAARETLTALGLSAKVQENRYVVVVPVRNKNMLLEVRNVVPDAFIDESKLGRYVNAGAFPNRASAESHSYLLRSYGFDARVEYFP